MERDWEAEKQKYREARERDRKLWLKNAKTIREVLARRAIIEQAREEDLWP